MSKSYRVFWALPPYSWPVSQDESCDTGSGTSDWRKLQTWEKIRKMTFSYRTSHGVILLFKAQRLNVNCFKKITNSVQSELSTSYTAVTKTNICNVEELHF